MDMLRFCEESVLSVGVRIFQQGIFFVGGTVNFEQLL